MGKRSKSRARHQALVAARRSTVQAGRSSAVWPGVVDGISGSSGARVRLARPDDEPAIRRFLIEATEDEGINDPAKPIPIVCPTVQAGLEDRHEGFIQALARELSAASNGTEQVEWPLVGFSLVAVDEIDQPVGSITVCPPYNYLGEIIEGRSDEDVKALVLQAQLGISKIIGVAVREDLRGRGIGADLVSTALHVLRRCNLGMIIFGSCEPNRAAFYRRQGFKVAPLNHPIDLFLALGIHAMISTPDHHIFSIERDLR